MPMFFVGMIIFAIAGIAVGTAGPLWVQGTLVVMYFIIMNTAWVARMEIGGIIPMMLGIAFIVGMFIGDISYLIQTGGSEMPDIANPFVVAK